MKCLIIANGELDILNFTRNILNEADHIICADGGANHLRRLGILPDVILGDLDSINMEDREYFEARNVRFETFPPRKDDTDTALATELALSMNPTEITYLGATGSRLDHTLANIGLLRKGLEAGVDVKIVNQKNDIRLMNRTLEISGTSGDTLSILPMTETVKGIRLEGLEYPLHDATLHLGSTRGISNVFVKSVARITIESGLLLVIKARD